ncbi:hypothetical protein A606_03625 [Corynebacterium terpenotabidum Y-11]|uniref:YwiC-like protein n=2 Tax=Corynebacterium terpenotabidum TaxID=89154 RepID=S4XCR1_9CORY|nr:hypothetical protein A606_03625 [Corynebacterium terpenotabidum Y-11]
MIIAPVLIGLAWLLGLRSILSDAAPDALASGFRGGVGTFLTALAVTVAWVVGYLTFFAGGKWLQARASGNTRIQDGARRPSLVYGAVTLVAVVCAVILQPHLLWWGIVFAPLTLIAVSEIRRGTPRSFIAGAAETVASAFLIPVLASVGVGSATPVVDGVTFTRSLFTTDVIEALPKEVWVTLLWLALYQVGTVLYVKTMIRKKGDRAWWIGSVAFHVAALAITVLTVTSDHLGLLSWFLAVMVLGWAAWRAYAVPKDATSAEPSTEWTPKKVGIAEIPVVVGITLACLLAAGLYDGPLVLFIH